nr:probable E3 ubiquitin-protein ligase ATL45 [Aegilops tauschii subsp. strangulata]
MGKMSRHQLHPSVNRPTAPATASSGTSMLTDTLLILAAVLCFMLCVVGLAMVTRCSRLCNTSAFSVDAPGAVVASCKGIKKRRSSRCPRTSASGGVQAAGRTTASAVDCKSRCPVWIAGIEPQPTQNEHAC